MLDLIKKFLTGQGFDITEEGKNRIVFVGFFGYTERVYIEDSIITFSRSFGTHKEFIAQDYKIESYDDFLFIVKKSISSSMYEIDVDICLKA